MLSIIESGILKVGTTGDYKPMSFLDTSTNSYWGYDIDFSKFIAKELQLKLEFIPTSWPTLSQDLLNKKFHIALSGISITPQRLQTFGMSKPYLNTGKTILCRRQDSQKINSLADVNKADIKVMINPGGTNQAFANENLTSAIIKVHSVNYEIPDMILQNKADVMVTETIEAAYYTRNNPGLAAPLINNPFTQNSFGILFNKNQQLEQILNQLTEKWQNINPPSYLH